MGNGVGRHFTTTLQADSVRATLKNQNRRILSEETSLQGRMTIYHTAAGRWYRWLLLLIIAAAIAFIALM